LRLFLCCLFAAFVISCQIRKGEGATRPYSISHLPPKIRAELKDFIYLKPEYVRPFLDINGGGSDSFSVFVIPSWRKIYGINIQTTEVSVGDYMCFAKCRNYPLNMPDTSSFPVTYKYIGKEYAAFYFRHPSFTDYPIVCVGYDQAEAYCAWKSEQLNKLIERYYPDFKYRLVFRLPTEGEWLHAAVNILQNRYGITHFDGELASRDKEVNFGVSLDQNNVLVRRSNSDGYDLTAPVRESGKTSIHRIMGNVAEWTSSSLAQQYKEHPRYQPDSNHVVFEYQCFPHRYDQDTLELSPTQKKVLHPDYRISKGGSWFHGIYYCNPAAILPVHKNAQEAWLGFRMVVDIVEKK
jgi:formylglycine-generating enzyme required for sulfatase activity